MNRIVIGVLAFALLLGSSSAQTAYQQACSPTVINVNDWIGICIGVAIFALMMAGAIYAVAGLLSTSMREKLRGAAKVEGTQALLSFLIIGAVLVFAVSTCQVGAVLTHSATATSGASYTDPMQYSQVYLENLLFVDSAKLFGSIYSASASYILWGNIEAELLTAFEEPITSFIGLELNANALGVYFGYAGVLTTTYTGLMVVTFGILFTLWILLPLIEALALPLILPVALIMRTVPFAGPRLREAADSFIAIAIAFFFVLPMTITMNSYVIIWLSCGSMGSINGPIAAPADCNPFVTYTGSNPLPTLNTDNFFQGNNPPDLGSPFDIPFTFLGGVLSGSGGIFSFILSGLKSLYSLPYTIDMYGVAVAWYLFEGIVLVALDLAITIGFAQGLTKGLGAISGIVGAGPFWGHV